jgi:hypothetical protein
MIMKLDPGERSILGYFPSSNKAQKAMDDIKALGIEVVALDRVSRYGVDNNSEINNPIAGQAETGTGLTLFSADTDRYSDSDSRVLMGADPSNSGMANSGYGIAGGKAFLVTVVTNESKVEEVVKVMKQHDGYV